MKCFRCGGIMIHEKFYGLGDDFFGWRCIICGEILDPVIIENRLAQRQQNFFIPDRARRRGQPRRYSRL
jgi:hypothetical protein